MDTRSLNRLIQSASSDQLDGIAEKLLSILGYSEIQVTDGRYDGGVDIKTAISPGETQRVAVQVSVRNDWEDKIRDDVKKVSESTEFSYVIFISSRRIPESEFQSVKSDSIATYGVIVDRYDSQSIASIFKDNGEERYILEEMGIELEGRGVSLSQSEYRHQAFASYTLFGEEPRKFRKKVVESAILHEIAQSGNKINRNKLESRVDSLLGLSDPTDGRNSSGAVDRMLQNRQIYYDQETENISTDEETLEKVSVEKTLYQNEKEELRESIQKYLHDVSPGRVTDDRLDSVMSNLGAIMMEAARETANSLDSDLAHEEIDRSTHVADRINEIHRTLDSVGVPEGHRRDEIVDELNRIASESPAGKMIFAGELYHLVTSMRTPQLVQALGGGRGIKVWLDASVAIPMICGLLYEPLDYRFGVGTNSLFRRIVNHGIPITIPKDYVEEMSFQMYRAYKEYKPIIEDFSDPDLKSSENPFAAHYSSLKEESERDLSFSEYIEGIGVPKGVERMDFDTAMSTIGKSIERILSDYNIETEPLYPDGSPEIDEVKRSLVGITSSYGKDRTDTTLNHDARTIAYLEGEETKSDLNNILCTWDEIPSIYSREQKSLWEVLTPPSLSDMLSLADPSDSGYAIKKPLQIAKRMTSESSEKGAAVWDMLVRIEDDGMYDAQLRNMAKNFKDEYMSTENPDMSQEGIGEAWSTYKSTHGRDLDTSRD